MVAETYLEPQYITYAMIESTLAKTSIKVTDDTDPEAPGIYIKQVETCMAMGEAWIIKNILANFVEIPLTTIDGRPFDDLYNDLNLRKKYADTYISIRDMFISSAIWQIYKNYFSYGGSDNGTNLIEQYRAKTNAYSGTYNRLDQAGNPFVKNAFSGLRRALNGSRRIGQQARSAACIPTGEDQSWAAFNAQPNLRWNFDR